MSLPVLNGLTVNTILDLASNVAEMVAGEDGKKFIDLARKVKDLVVEAKDIVAPDDGVRLDVAREDLDALIAKVNAHADETLDRLKG